MSNRLTGLMVNRKDAKRAKEIQNIKQ